MTAAVALDLTDLPPGPGLAAALGALELSAVPNDRMLDVLAAQYRQLCHEQARMAAVLAEVGRCPGSPAAGAVARSEVPERYAPDETRAALRWTRHAADAEHELAERVVHTMPALFAAWIAGVVDRPRVLVFDRYLLGSTVEQIDAVCRVAVPRAPRLTTGQLAVLLRRLVLAVDPDAAERWYRKGVRDRDLVAVMAPDGTVTMSAHGLPADEAEAACVRVQDLAAAAKRAGHPGRIGQIRTDLYLGLLDGRFHEMTAAQIVAALLIGAPPADRPAGPAAAGHAAAGHAAAGHAAAGTGSGVPAAAGGPGSGVPASGGHAPGGPVPGDRVPGDRVADGSGAGDAVPGGSGAGGSDAGGAVPGGRVPPGDQRVGIEIRVALSTLLGLDEHPGEIPGLGLLGAADARARVALQRRAQWRFAVTGPDGELVSEGCTLRRPRAVGGHPVGRGGPRGGVVELHVPVALLAELAAGPRLPDGWSAVIADLADRHARRESDLVDLDADPAARLPRAALRRHTEIRDRTCRFPGCRRPARRSEIDHTRDHAEGGPTTRANTGPVCDHDHDLKHRGGWRLDQPAPGEFVWRSPLGGTYRTRGTFLLPPMPDPVRGDPGPDPGDTGVHVEGPILRPHRPVQPPRPPPAAPQLPDEPPF